jgi:predicted AlkP superfamily pyrophosphatase or phosphodiesterase
MNNQYNIFRHLRSATLMGLFFGLIVGVIFGIKMIGINEAMRDYRYAYPFMLNFIPLYLGLGLFFGMVSGFVGGILLRKNDEQKSLSYLILFGISILSYLVVYFIAGVPLGPILGMILAALVLVTMTGFRPPLLRLYFSVLFTSITFNYSWQWLRKHFIANPLDPNPAIKLHDLIFTIIWGIFFIIGFRIFLKALNRLPAKLIAIASSVLIVLTLTLGGVYYLVKPGPAQAKFQNVEITRHPTGAKVLVIGIDGFWWNIIEPMLDQHLLPNIQKMIKTGSYGPLKTLYPTFSAAIWTSISTGKSPEKHGVTSFLVWKFPWSGLTVPCFITPRITQEMDFFRTKLIVEAPITNQFLNVTPIWLMLSNHGASVGSINWWVSWPADSVNGFVVTDHALYNKDYVITNYKQKEGNTVYDAYPPEILEELNQFSHRPNDLTEEEISRFINVDNRKFLDDFYAINTYDYLDITYEASMFKYSYPEDVTFTAATQYLLQNRQPEFTCVYLKGMDSMEHQYLKYYFANEHPDKLLPENRDRYKDLIRNYYEYMDEVIGKLRAAADSTTITIVVSDHGFDNKMLPTGHYNHLDSPPGVFLCAGPGIRSELKINDAHVYDITPTVLHLLGFPTAEDFDGKVLTEVVENDPGVTTIPTYETGRRATRKLLQSEIDKTYKDRLRALGYTQ